VTVQLLALSSGDHGVFAIMLGLAAIAAPVALIAITPWDAGRGLGCVAPLMLFLVLLGLAIVMGNTGG
jgi:hypothetical protein